MTLIVSLRTSDGIVIAGDSYSTMRAQLEVGGKIRMECPKCGHVHEEDKSMASLNIPTATLSYAQKVFPFMDNFGVGSFGSGQLSGKTMYFALRELEDALRTEKKSITTVTKAAKLIGERAQSLLKQQTPDFENAPEDSYALGFQIVGYDEEKATTVILHIGKNVNHKEETETGCTWTGDGRVVQAIWGLSKTQPTDNPKYESMSLQDAIEYAEFLIRTTSDHQKFARTIATVGGDIDVALVTPFDGFKWIRRKPLSEIIDRRRI